MSRSWPAFMLRIPDALRDKLNRAARLNRRSLNSEILARCEQADHNTLTRQDLDELHRRIDQLEAIIRQSK